MKSDSDVI